MGIREEYFIAVCNAGISVNLVLMALNLIPIPPLDGGRIVAGLLPNRLSWEYSKIEPYGMWILLALIATGMLNVFMRPFPACRSLAHQSFRITFPADPKRSAFFSAAAQGA